MSSAPTRVVLFLAGLCFLSACSGERRSGTVRAEIATTRSVSAPEPKLDEGTDLRARAAATIAAIHARDAAALSAYTHPTKGVRFVPYRAPDATDVVLDAAKVNAAFHDPTRRTWGAYDGSGEPIEGRFVDYFDQFVNDVDFAHAPHAGEVQPADPYLAGAFPGAMVVEYRFDGFDAKFEGMDWRALRLVFEQDGEKWWLVGVVHDQWMI
jgi:hypothetical protein